MVPGWLWVAFTVFAAAGQTARNAMQRELIGHLGAGGATHVRFLFGVPFALGFLALVATMGGHPLPQPRTDFWLWVAVGALAQIAGTALMLMTMMKRSFVVATAYLKTEPVQVALMALAFFGDPIRPSTIAAIVIATAGVIVLSWKPGAPGGAKPALLGLAGGAFFALSAIAFRAAIVSVEDAGFVMAATFSLAIGLGIQAAALSAYLAVREPGVLAATFKLWRPSLTAGFLGAVASQFWFLAFALTSAANVRTLGLVDVIFAQAVSHYVFRARTTLREAIGIATMLAGITLLLATHSG
jgi:drug/metabolite transporter (DMT)-like permease